MSNPNNVQIPYETFSELLDIFEYLEEVSFADDFKSQLEAVGDVLRAKKNSLDRRQAYTDFKRSHGAQRDEKRIEYMKKRGL